MDRHHIHMNATRWLTLSEFTEWLGKEGYAEVDYQVFGVFESFVQPFLGWKRLVLGLYR